MELTTRGEIPVHASRIEFTDALAASRRPRCNTPAVQPEPCSADMAASAYSVHDALLSASRRAGHDLIKPGTATYVDRCAVRWVC